MNTPRLRSSYPSTPRNDHGGSVSSDASPGGRREVRPLSNDVRLEPNIAAADSPVIPLTVLDAPAQRFYVLAIYVALLGWRLFDWSKLVEDEVDSFWQFIKWVAIDCVFLFGLPGLRIPWLEWSNPTITGIFLLHAAFNGILMFRIPIPVETWLAVLVKTLYDREISVSENRVKLSSILHNSSLIMGKQIINVLPEGHVTLNPDGLPFCLDSKHSSVKLPIRLNQTHPIQIELLRIDFDTNINETIIIGQREIHNLQKVANSRSSKVESEAATLYYNAKKTGLYRLHRVLEKANLEVQRRMSDTLVVNCPRATIHPSTSDRCVSDLSDLTIDVEGTPPLKIVYSRTVNKEDQSFHFQSLQPENLISPLLSSTRASTLVTRYEENVSWGRSQSVQVRLNESMTPAGNWLYSIDEVHDATGNVANFSERGEDGEHIYPKGSHLEHAFTVHDRPVARLERCDVRTPLRVASGSKTTLPVDFGSGSRGSVDGVEYHMTWLFSPIDKLTAAGDHGNDAVVEEFVTKNPRQRPEIHRPGLYTLRTVSDKFCEGHIREPASCLLLNPPEPDLAISSEDIFDKCAGNSIGIFVNMDLTGTPPFIVRYDVIQNKKTVAHSVRIEGSRHQLELKPQNAGHFTYRFTTVDDAVYKGHSLVSKALALEQDVKPPASASFIRTPDTISACIDKPVEVDVQLLGETPFTLEYELVYEGKRRRTKIPDITENFYQISTDPLVQGGEYTLALTSVQDKTGCKIFLNSEVHINVRRQKPKAIFGKLDGKRSVKTLEGDHVELPLRLEGEAPWVITYRNLNDSSGQIIQTSKSDSNDHIKVSQRGAYELVGVTDSHCPGSVDSAAAVFNVDWISRPEVRIAESPAISLRGDRYIKREVCEGELDTIEINLTGTPPYHLKYQQRHTPDRGSQSVTNKEIDAALGIVTISMNTANAGLYTYRISELSDAAYDHDTTNHQPLVIEQTVSPKPSAYFTRPSQSYKYCKDDATGEEMIPITLEGLAPFYLEIDIKQQSSSKPETVKIPNIESNRFEFRIPRTVLSLGTHQVSIRKVRDARGCQRKTEFGAPHVQVQVFDVPTIYALESQTDYCVGDRISYTLSGTPPFDIYYTFGGVQRKAKSPSTNFRRIAEKPGNFTITAISDVASECKASVDITKQIHEMPSVKISKGRQVSVDIHEGGEAEILFEFWGTPPFEFTYTRSTNAKKGQKSQVLETRHDVSHEHTKIVQASQEGTYEVVAIKDKFCAFSTQRLETKPGQKLLKF